MAIHYVYHVLIAHVTECIATRAFSDSKIASKLSSVKMKSTTKIKNATAPFTFTEIIKDLNTSTFYWLATKYKLSQCRKNVPSLVQYFSSEKGLLIRRSPGKPFQIRLQKEEPFFAAAFIELEVN